MDYVMSKTTSVCRLLVLEETEGGEIEKRKSTAGIKGSHLNKQTGRLRQLKQKG